MKAAARQIFDTSTLEVPAYALGTQALWTPALVKSALVEAHQVLSDTTDRVGPARLRAAWPEYYRDWGDLIAQAENGVKPKNRIYRRRSSLDIQRMEIVLLGARDRFGVMQPAWLNGSVTSYERPRKCLIAWVMCQHHGVTEKALCERNQWPLATFRRHKDFAAGVIAQNLNAGGVEVW